MNHAELPGQNCRVLAFAFTHKCTRITEEYRRIHPGAQSWYLPCTVFILSDGLKLEGYLSNSLQGRSPTWRSQDTRRWTKCCHSPSSCPDSLAHRARGDVPWPSRLSLKGASEGVLGARGKRASATPKACGWPRGSPTQQRQLPQFGTPRGAQESWWGQMSLDRQGREMWVCRRPAERLRRGN